MKLRKTRFGNLNLNTIVIVLGQEKITCPNTSWMRIEFSYWDQEKLDRNTFLISEFAIFQ